MKNKNILFYDKYFISLFPTGKRLSIALLKLILLFIPILNVSAQEKKINLNLSNVTLNEAMRIIEKNTEYVFYYNNSGIDLNRKVSLNVNEADIADILAIIMPVYKYNIEKKKNYYFTSIRCIIRYRRNNNR